MKFKNSMTVTVISVVIIYIMYMCQTFVCYSSDEVFWQRRNWSHKDTRRNLNSWGKERQNDNMYNVHCTYTSKICMLILG